MVFYNKLKKCNVVVEPNEIERMNKAEYVTKKKYDGRSLEIILH